MGGYAYLESANVQGLGNKTSAKRKTKVKSKEPGTQKYGS